MLVSYMQGGTWINSVLIRIFHKAVALGYRMLHSTLGCSHDCKVVHSK